MLPVEANHEKVDTPDMPTEESQVDAKKEPRKVITFDKFAILYAFEYRTCFKRRRAAFRISLCAFNYDFVKHFNVYTTN